MNTQVLVTVTTAPGRPTFLTSADTDIATLRRIVKRNFHLQCDGQSPGIEHSFCANHLAPGKAIGQPLTQGLLVNPGHLRVF